MIALFAGCATPNAPLASTADDPLVEQDWRIDASASIGWALAVGTRQAYVGQFDAEHCPGLTFVVPTSARSLRVAVAPSLSSGVSEVGHYELALEGPEGEPLRALWPATSTDLQVDDPAAGGWTLRAWPVGVALAHTWPVEIAIVGEGAPPTGPLEPSPMC